MFSNQILSQPPGQNIDPIDKILFFPNLEVNMCETPFLTTVEVIKMRVEQFISVDFPWT